MMNMKRPHLHGFASITGMYVTPLSLLLFNFNTSFTGAADAWKFAIEMHRQVRGEDADDPTTYLVTFGESEARYAVNA